MDIAIIYIPVGTNAFPAIQLAFTAPLAYASDGDKMVLIERTDQLACLAQPFLECRQLLLTEGSWLIAYLP